MIFTETAKKEWLDDLIDIALAEDIGSGDVTTDAIVDDQKKAKAVWIAKQNGTVAGLEVAKWVFQKLDPEIDWNPFFQDGDSVKKGEILVEFSGKCRAILTAERTALNIVQRMSGIATKTSEIVQTLDSYSVKILDTRKTAPGLRKLDKQAVKAGGGINHRMGLFDLAMIKENHIRAGGSIAKAVKHVRSAHPEIEIEVEATTIKEVREALEAGSDIIMLDNMDSEQMRTAVSIIGDRAKTEASGNITSNNIQEVAETGVNFISIGALTHSVNAFDISQQIKELY